MRIQTPLRSDPQPGSVSGPGPRLAPGAATGGVARALDLDLFKTMLVAGMIAAHVVQLLAAEAGPMAVLLSEVVNLVTFSGFMLAFGLGLGLSDGSGRTRPLAARLARAAPLLLAVYASSFGYLVLVEREVLTARLVTDVLTTRRLFGWSEFLTSFLVLYLLVAVARPALLGLAARPRLLLAAVAACLATTLVTTDRLWPLIGGVVGHLDYANFPILAYGPWFLAGLHLGMRRRGVDAADLALGAALTGAFALVWWREGYPPDRFPPSLLWVVGPGLILGAYLWVARRAAPRVPAPGILLAAGRHVLTSLVVSNLAIFAIRRVWGRAVEGPWAILAASLALIAAVTAAGAARTALSGRRRRVVP